MTNNDTASQMKTGLVGYGYWGPNLARNVAACPATVLAAICDADETARQRAAHAHPHVRVEASFDALLASDIEAVIISLPMRLHHEFALAALEADKHVLVEKPLAMTVTECDQLIETAETRNLTLMVGHTFLFNGAVRRARHYLVEGDLGEPYYVTMRRTNLGIVRSDGNAMWSLAPHDVSILEYWLDSKAVEVSATGIARLQEDIEDAVFLSIRFANGVLGHVHCSWLEPHKVRDATIVGSRKMLVYDDTAPETKLWLYDKGIEKRSLGSPGDHPSLGRYETFARFQMITRAGDVLLPKIELGEPLALQIENFAESVRSGTEPVGSGAQGRSVVAVLQAAGRSLASGGEPQLVEGAPVA